MCPSKEEQLLTLWMTEINPSKVFTLIDLLQNVTGVEKRDIIKTPAFLMDPCDVTVVES